jgi:hypothetical protein
MNGRISLWQREIDLQGQSRTASRAFPRAPACARAQIPLKLSTIADVRAGIVETGFQRFPVPAKRAEKCDVTTVDKGDHN